MIPMNQPRRAAAEDALYKKVTLRVMPFLFVAYMVSCLFGLGMGMLLGGNGLFLAVGNLE